MVSLETCEKLKREFEQILSKEENLLDEEDFFFDLFAKSNCSGKVLELARELKEEGNVFFKSGLIDEALENYGHAGVALLKFNFKEEEERVVFFDLVIALLLNLSACLSKKNEFGLVGRVCSVIIDYCPNKVKAFYRRAEAAINLGKLDWAYWDLLLAAEIEPKNKEVSKKLDEVKGYMHRNGSNSNREYVDPIGLGVSLPPPKKSKKKIEFNGARDKGQVYEVSQAAEGSCVSGNVNLKDEKDFMTDVSVSDSRSMSSSSTKLQEEQVSRSWGISNLEKAEVSNKNENSQLGKSKYHFNNRKRQSSITINERDYLSMAQGKTLRFYNSKMGCFMEVKLAREQVDKSVSKTESNDQGSKCQMQIDGQSSFKEEVQDNTNLIKELEDCVSCVSYGEKSQNSVDSKYSHNTIDDRTCQTTMAPQFCFSANSEFKTKKKRHQIKDYGLNHLQQNNRRRRKICDNSDASCFLTNNFFSCRYHAGKKRKTAPPPSLPMVQLKKKKKMFESNCSFKFNSSISGSLPCDSPNNCSSVAHEMVCHQSNG